MIGIAHGYGLAGAGSNLWTRETVSALCDNGETVHLMCQESNPDRFDFVAELWTYDEDGRAERQFVRETPRAGRCVVHRTRLDVLPTYVRPDRESAYVRSILDLPDDALEGYVSRNLAVLRHASREHGIDAWHVNHTILLSESARRLREESGTRFAVMPHGSALEYVVRHDERMLRVARRVLEATDAVFALNQEIRDRLARFFPDLDLEPKTRTVRVGVDTERFRPVPRDQRAASVERLAAALEGVERGRTPEQAHALARGVAELDDAADPGSFRERIAPALAYTTSRPDEDLEAKLRTVDWTKERVITFVGRLIPAKGVAAIVVALPLILDRHPRTRLILVGAGWLREYLEAFVLALAGARSRLAIRILEWAEQRSPEETRPSGTAFLQALERSNEIGHWIDRARRLLRPDRVLFTGFLEHSLLAHVFPLADVAVFPSAVAEASPLVVPESAACGCLPMGTDFAGMRRSLDALDPVLPAPVRPLLRLDPDPERTAAAIARNVTAAFDLEADPRPALREAAVTEYDWHSIARVVASELAGLTAG